MVTKKEIYQALADGKQLQERNDDRPWADISELEVVVWYLDGEADDQLWRLRVKQGELPPESGRVPLQPKDVLVTTQFREKRYPSNRFGYDTVTDHGVRLNFGPSITRWSDLAEHFERTDDSGKTWQPCSKKEVKR